MRAKCVPWVGSCGARPGSTCLGSTSHGSALAAFLVQVSLAVLGGMSACSNAPASDSESAGAVSDAGVAGELGDGGTLSGADEFPPSSYPEVDGGASVPPSDPVTTAISGGVNLPPGVSLRMPLPIGTTALVSNSYGAGFHTGVNDSGSMNQHYAVDLYIQPDGAKGTPSLAIADGTVLLAGWSPAGWASCGMWVVLQHDFGDGHTYISNSCHLNAVSVSPGDHVSAGDVIGELGCSSDLGLGCDRWGPHAHISMARDANVAGGSYGGNTTVPEPMSGYTQIETGMYMTAGAGGFARVVAEPRSISALGRCADVDHGGTEDGVKVQTWACNGSDPQSWTMSETGQLQTSIGKCLARKQGTQLLEQSSCDDSIGQRFKFLGVALRSAFGKCVDVPGQHFIAGEKLQLYDCNATDAQRWIFDPAGKTLRSQQELCLQLAGGTAIPGADIELAACTGTPAQRWYHEDGVFRSGVDQSFCLDVEDGQSANGTRIQLWQCDGTPAQHFALSGGIRSAENSESCVDVPGGDASDGNQLQLHACNGTAAQDWDLW